MTSKFCNKCQQNKLLNNFYKDKRSKDGLQSKCIACDLKYRQDNAEKIKKRKREYNAKNSEKYKPYFKNYREKNKEKITMVQKDYRLKNAEKIKKQRHEYKEMHRKELSEKTKEYKKLNPEIVNNYTAKRKSKKRLNGVFLVSKKELKKIYSSNCFYCGSNKSIQMDHVIPISKGGRHSIGNIIPACAKCNLDKRDKYLIEWKYQKKCLT